ncbi:MAG: IclR family transcriptional regulator [Deltaproteobacteria bacterium]|nr:IclR family transcriptional regulator [Deltaproteobacteria bacterium]
MPNQSIQRAAQILSLFSMGRPQLKLSQIAKELSLPIGTVHGLVRTLEEEGFLTQDPPTREYRLGLRLHLLGSIQMATMEFNQKAAGPMNYLARQTDLVARTGILTSGTVVITMSTFPLTNGVAGPYLGVQTPAYCTSLGRAILAFLPPEEASRELECIEIVRYTPKTVVDREELLAEIAAARDKGYAVVHQEFEMHMSTIGAPIFAAGSRPVAAISVSGEPARVAGSEGEGLAHRVMETAAEISGYLGHTLAPLFRHA